MADLRSLSMDDRRAFERFRASLQKQEGRRVSQGDTVVALLESRTKAVQLQYEYDALCSAMAKAYPLALNRVAWTPAEKQAIERARERVRRA